MPPDLDPPSAGPPDPHTGPPPTGRGLVDALFAEVQAQLVAPKPAPAADGPRPTLAQLRDELAGLYAGMLAATARLDREGQLDAATRVAAFAALHDLRAALREIEPPRPSPGGDGGDGGDGG